MPVRKGGPWEYDDEDWSVYVNGQQDACWPKPFRAHNGAVEYVDKSGWIECGHYKTLAGIEFRPPKYWTGDLPEGTRLATDFVAGQRVRVPGGMAERQDGRVVQTDGPTSKTNVKWPNGVDYWYGKHDGLEGY